jgi:hypothetical protein
MAEMSTVDIATYPSKAEAEFAASVLLTNDIEAFVQAGGTGGEQVGAPTVAGFAVFVEANQADKAREVLSGVYPEDDLTYKSVEERRKDGTARLFPVPIFVLGVFAGGLLVGAALAVNSFNKTHFTGTRFYGSVKEKKRGTWDIYESGQIVRRQIDRNSDGRPDLTMFYSGTELQRIEYDDNFDGQPDEWVYFKDGNPLTAKIDTDFNGVPDEFVTYENGIRAQAEFRPNEASTPIRIEYYKNGLKVRQIDEPDAAGELSREVTYDSFGRETSAGKRKVGA